MGLLPDDTRLGAVRLTVGDLPALTAFYERAIGLRVLDHAAATAVLGAGDAPLVVLHGDPDAPVAPSHCTGLFHLALLVPGRPELAQAVQRVAAAGWRFTGASDHFVSEAMYLRDPEGNGIELYRDRPRDAWHSENGELRMGTVALDLNEVMAELPAGDDPGMDPATTMGHVHLQVADIPDSERFWVDAVGFDATTRGYPGALFVAAGGYHHHLGLNTWETAGASPPPAGARGLRSFEIVLPSQADADAAIERARDGGALAQDGRVTDPSGAVATLSAG